MDDMKPTAKELKMNMHAKIVRLRARNAGLVAALKAMTEVASELCDQVYDNDMLEKKFHDIRDAAEVLIKHQDRLLLFVDTAPTLPIKEGE